MQQGSPEVAIGANSLQLVLKHARPTVAVLAGSSGIAADMGSPQNCFSGFLQSSELSKLQKEHQSLKDGAQKAATQQSLEHDKLLKLQKEYQSLKDGAQKAATQQSLEHDKLHKELEATKLELHRLRSFMGNELQGTKRENAAQQIQFHTRKFLKDLRDEREMREKARRYEREKREKVRRKGIHAVTRLQRLWRMRSQQRRSRWQTELERKAGDQTQYDAILGFESLAKFLREGEIPLLQKAESYLQVVRESRYRIVAVVGLFDKGKTWLLNKLFGATWP